MIFRRHSIEVPIETLTYKSDLYVYILPLELHAEIQLCMSMFGRESGNKHAHTHRRGQNYYTWGVMKGQ